MEHWQDITALLIVGWTVGWMLRRTWRKWRTSSQSGCVTGCVSCPINPHRSTGDAAAPADDSATSCSDPIAGNLVELRLPGNENQDDPSRAKSTPK